MDFTREGLVGIEDKGNEAEVLGHALALGQTFVEVAREEGYEIPETPEQILNFAVTSMGKAMPDAPDIVKSALKRYKEVEVDTSPRYINDEAELRALISGLTIFAGFSVMPRNNKHQSQAISKSRAIGLSGENGRAILLDRKLMKQVPRYHRRIFSRIAQN